MMSRGFGHPFNFIPGFHLLKVDLDEEKPSCRSPERSLRLRFDGVRMFEGKYWSLAKKSFRVRNHPNLIPLAPPPPPPPTSQCPHFPKKEQINMIKLFCNWRQFCLRNFAFTACYPRRVIKKQWNSKENFNPWIPMIINSMGKNCGVIRKGPPFEKSFVLTVLVFSRNYSGGSELMNFCRLNVSLENFWWLEMLRGRMAPNKNRKISF